MHNSFFILKDGTVKACGTNGYGQLGDGIITNRSTPVVVTNLNEVKQVSLGKYFWSTFFLLYDGTVKACGDNRYGELGDGTSIDRSIPVLAPGLSGVKQVSTSGLHSIFLLNDGTVKVCGNNDYGQLGDGTTVNMRTPVLVPGLSGVKQVDVGYHNTVFL